MIKNYIIAVLAGAIVISICCGLYNLERGLPKDIQAWYDLHEIIMEYPIPKDLGKGTEQEYFLHLSEPMQRLYIKNFWAMREIGMDKEYAFRIALANSAFRGEGKDGWRTDRGMVLRLCGQPDYEDHYKNEEIYNEGEEEWQITGSASYTKVWKYWWSRGNQFLSSLIEITFYYDGNRCWRHFESSYAIDRDFMQYWRWRMAPTEDGWALWRSML